MREQMMHGSDWMSETATDICTWSFVGSHIGL